MDEPFTDRNMMAKKTLLPKQKGLPIWQAFKFVSTQQAALVAGVGFEPTTFGL
jgi:hypothetical protein